MSYAQIPPSPTKLVTAERASWCVPVDPLSCGVACLHVVRAQTVVHTQQVQQQQAPLMATSVCNAIVVPVVWLHCVTAL